MPDTALVDLVYERHWSSLNNLVAALRGMDCMGRLYGGFPRFRYEKAGIPREIIRTFPAASLWNFGARRIGLPEGLLLDEPRWVGNWAARHSDLASVVMANGTAHRYLFPQIKETGKLLILERGSTHPIDLYLKPQQARKEAGFDYSFELPNAVLDEIEKTELADYILAGSEVIKSSYVAHGFPAERILVASYGVDINQFIPSHEQAQRASPLRIGIVGILSFRKGVLRALRIGEWASKVGIKLELHFVGPVFDPECLQLIKTSPARCVLHGVLKGSFLREFLQSCDAICLPSYEEGFGISVLEGMSTGLPAIVSREAGCSEAVMQGINGMILEKFDESEFDHVLDAPLRDREALATMGFAARETVVSNYQTSHSITRIQQAVMAMVQTESAPQVRL
jgi:glycosyltransferase involved in cell wall biosynthesis